MHPRQVLHGALARANALPVCDHYCGVETRIRKSLALQAEMTAKYRACVFDVTLDCEDGAPVGAEREHAEMVAALAHQAWGESGRLADGTDQGLLARIAVRVHPVDHPAFEQDVRTIVGAAGSALCHVMIPKVESVSDVEQAVRAIDRACAARSAARALPLHVLIESSLGVHHAHAIAAHPRVQSLSFGLMDFVAAHAGAIPASAMAASSQTAGTAPGQFSHPLVLRAKLEIAAACHAYGKTPSHCVVTEFSDRGALRVAATRAARELGYTRMWSIHPDQILPILEAFAPAEDEIELAAQIVVAADHADWAPVSIQGKLHDRASYRYYWELLERAHQTGRLLPPAARPYFFAPDGAVH